PLALRALSRGTLHLCVDMQVIFAEPTPWHMPWLRRVLPSVARLVAHCPSRTLFTRFIPADRPGDGTGMWQEYYKRWSSMTLQQLHPSMIELVPELAIYAPPARVYDKRVYSPGIGSDLAQRLRSEDVDTLVVSGGETDVCVLSS